MKKLLLIFAFTVLGALSLVAQDRDQDRDRDRLMLVDGDVLQIRDRDQTRLHDQLTLTDGTVVNADGTYQKKGGDRLRLRDGECLDMTGTLYSNEYQYRAKIKQENQNLTQNQMMERNKNRYHLTMIDGNMYQIKNQEQSRLQQKLNLGNGTTVNPDGTYQKGNRKLKRLKEGQCFNMDGKMFKNTYQQRKMILQKNRKANKNMDQNMNRNKVQKKPSMQKINKVQKKGRGN